MHIHIQTTSKGRAHVCVWHVHYNDTQMLGRLQQKVFGIAISVLRNSGIFGSTSKVGPHESVRTYTDTSLICLHTAIHPLCCSCAFIVTISCCATHGAVSSQVTPRVAQPAGRCGARACICA